MHAKIRSGGKILIFVLTFSSISQAYAEDRLSLMSRESTRTAWICLPGTAIGLAALIAAIRFRRISEASALVPIILGTAACGASAAIALRRTSPPNTEEPAAVMSAPAPTKAMPSMPESNVLPPIEGHSFGS